MKLNNRYYIVHRSIIGVCLFLIVLASPCAVHAAGLGNLTLSSYLRQPFRAEIDLVAVKKEEIPSLVVSLASRDTFRQANVNYAPFLFTFEISVENRADGQPYIKITSPQRVVEPFLSMLIELNWSSGRLIREYTVLLDPPENALLPTAPAMQVEPVIPSFINPEPALAEQPDSIIEDLVRAEEPAVQEAAPIPEAVPVEKSDAITYGSVKSGDTLTKIALEVAPNYQVQPNQMVVALLKNVQDKIIGPMQENAIARENKLNEANEHIALLEKNIKELQHLLELKNPTMAKAQEQAESTTPDAELSSSAVVSSMVEEPSVDGEESSLFTWQWLWWVLLPIAGWGWKHWKDSKNGATEAKERHPSYYNFIDTYKTLRSKERAVRRATMS
jgi:Tfp pilus assembly protein FimV